MSDRVYVKNCSLDVFGNRIQNVADPIGVNDALGKTYADNRYYLNTVPLNSITAPTASVSLNSQKIVNVLDPTLAQDASTKNYVDTRTINTLAA